MGAARNVGEGLIDGNPLNKGRKIINYLDGRIAHLERRIATLESSDRGAASPKAQGD